MALLLRSRVVLTASVLLSGYWLAALTLPYAAFAEVLNAVRFAFAVAVVLLYAPAAVEAARTPRPNRTQQLILGIETTWAAVAGVSLWGGLGRLFVFSTRLPESTVTGMTVFGLILGATLHMTAPGDDPADVKIDNWWAVLVAVLVGGMIAGFILSSAWWRAWLGLPLVPPLPPVELN